MKDEEVTLAMAALRSAYQYTPMADVTARQFGRLFAGYTTETVRAVIDDLIAKGLTRPGPAEMGEMLRTKAGVGAAGGRARRYGPTLDDDGWSDGMVPANEPGWLEAAAEAKRRLHAPTDAELLSAESQAAQRRAEHEIASRPDWWGVDA